MTAAILRDISACYLIVTLVATSLAKLWTWRQTSIGLVAEAVISEALAAPTVLAISIAELVLAATLVVGLRDAGYAAASLFGIFGVYRIAVLATTKTIRCGCAGVPRISAATPAAIAATGTTTIVQVALGILFALAPSSRYFSIAAIGAFLAPVIMLARGYLGQLGRCGGSHQMELRPSTPVD